jgi:hypothetical protein
MTRQAWLVVVAAIAGLAMAVALALLTSHLTTQHVGLAGEPSQPAPGLIAPPAATTPVAPARTTPATSGGRHHQTEKERGDD